MDQQQQQPTRYNWEWVGEQLCIPGVGCIVDGETDGGDPKASAKAKERMADRVTDALNIEVGSGLTPRQLQQQREMMRGCLADDDPTGTMPAMLRQLASDLRRASETAYSSWIIWLDFQADAMDYALANTEPPNTEKEPTE